MDRGVGSVVATDSDSLSCADSAMAQTVVSQPQKKMVRKVKSLTSKIFHRKTKSKDAHPQLESPLFNQFPQEIRDRIWYFAFLPLGNSRPAHFHIYDEVFDACTYQKPKDSASTQRAELRRKQNNIALLLSCRRIYYEALDYMYCPAKFTFVVSAGRPREHCREKYSDRCKSLGMIKDCEQMFRRIRNLTIIIQPGKNPNIDLYIARLSHLLEVLDYGRHLQWLHLIFNYRLEIARHDLTQDRRKKIVETLKPLHQHLAPKVAAGKARLSVAGWKTEIFDEQVLTGEQSKYHELIYALGGVDKSKWTIAEHPIGPSEVRPSIRVQSEGDDQDADEPNEPRPECKLFPWDPQRRLDKVMCVGKGAELRCLERGAFGEDYYALKNLQPTPRTPVNWLPYDLSKEELEALLIVAAYLSIWPISLPITAFAVVKRKKAKGEWR